MLIGINDMQMCEAEFKPAGIGDAAGLRARS